MRSWLLITVSIVFQKTCQHSAIANVNNINANIALARRAVTVDQLQKPLLSTKNRNEEHEQVKGNGATYTKYNDLADRIKVDNLDSSPVDTSVDNTSCQIEISERSVSFFRHKVYYSQSNFVYLRLKPNTSAINITGDKNIIGEKVWVWTFYGRDGALEFLNWPMEFGIWSMGLLTSAIIQTPIDLDLYHVAGDCTNIHVGNISDDLIISQALVALAKTMTNLDNEKYGPSFWCYKRRMFIEPQFVYDLCKHIVCPVEALKYSCCSYFFNIKSLLREASCEEYEFKYDSTWWILPTVLAAILFAFCPLLLMNLAHNLLDPDDERLPYRAYEMHAQDEEIALLGRIVFMGERQYVTLFNTILYPFNKCVQAVRERGERHVQFILFRLTRIFIPLLSLSVIGLQISLDYFYLHTFILAGLDKGVPLGFRSMIAGYESSKNNFLPFLGGPFVAVSIYLVITCPLIIIPESLSELLISGLPHNRVEEPITPLKLSLKTIEMYGSLNIRSKSGYKRLYNAFLAQFYMLINIRFWQYVLDIQIERWRSLNCFRYCLLFLPLYMLLCFLEMLLCISFYGLPIASFGLMIIKAYFGKIDGIYNKTSSSLLYMFISSIILTSSVGMFLFMFCTIFLDATLFFVRIVMFTYTGIVVYPKLSYGYLIFALTVIYYLWESVKEFSLIYHRLLRDTISVSESLQRANDVGRLVVKMHHMKGIRESLFEHVIESICPRRKQVIISLLKVGIILGILGVSINLLLKIGGFRDLHVVMNVVTALFVCALPKIMKTMYREANEKLTQRRHKQDLKDSVKSYLGFVTSHANNYFVNE